MKEQSAIMLVRPKRIDDTNWTTSLLIERWGCLDMIVNGERINLTDLPMVVAEPKSGVATYRIREQIAELISLDSAKPNNGVGTQMLAYLQGMLLKLGIKILYVTTTNDNLAALAFYQRRGFTLEKLRCNEVARARSMKPEIPLINDQGIPIRDELLLALRLS